MAKKRRRRKQKGDGFKVTKVFVIFNVILVIAIVAAIILVQPSAKEKFKAEYGDAASALTTSTQSITPLNDDDHVFVKKSVQDVISMSKDSGLMFVYYCSPEDSSSVANLPAINTYAKAYDVKEVVVLENKFYTDLDTTVLEGQEKADDYSTKLQGVTLTALPSVWVYQDGKLIFDSASKDFISDDNQPLYTWDQLLNKAFSLNKNDTK